MAVREALALCPELVLVCGEDLAEYRRVGAQSIIPSMCVPATTVYRAKSACEILTKAFK